MLREKLLIFFMCSFGVALSYPIEYEETYKVKTHITLKIPNDKDNFIGADSVEKFLESIQDAFFHTYGDDKDGDGDLQGYSKKYDDDGEDGYKHFDSYHKKDGDNYAFEKHTEYGQENKNEADAGEKSQKLQENEEINDYDDAEEEDETKNVYKVAVPLKEVGKKYLKSNPSATYRQKRQSDDRSYERRSNRRRDRYDDDDDDDDDDRRGRRYRQSDEDDDDY
ncbi:unnamed protein product [Brassicogethes aeneus]|uniref:Uncharacterized protein n=1 Tax=Brassicogethes aeneus TaxID=1431903 RepID=A0A9P0FFB8_BRAAE|nr:unnamed protein product [Brassicogethes aeneus]